MVNFLRTCQTFPIQLYHFTISPAGYEGFNFSISSQILRIFSFDDTSCWVSHCGFKLHLCHSYWCGTSFHVLIGYLCIFSGEMPTQTLCPFQLCHLLFNILRNFQNVFQHALYHFTSSSNIWEFWFLHILANTKKLYCQSL